MTLSPLQLQRYYIEEFACKANSEYRETDERKPENLEVYFESGVNDKNPLQRRIRLTIEQKIGKDGNEPYSFKVVMVAFFEVVKKFFDEKGAEEVDKIVNANGPALLYSAARELLALVSGRGPYTTKDLDVFLPTITFINFKPMVGPPEKKAGKATKKAISKSKE